ncbi:uncharacterized protein DUF4386 [Paenibacillus cellulosilyticus]|uniref:Uncharacterized protein DUF4386 n=1 Tax=Paenibacillus cellulosilyticus TaxID=375489 RepID=A0A2V2YVK5_9BACL|nr:DUF4386 domain-containing protein [Paenibacillus cellulosilyticus]PWW05129.1 uncharacterized protein DUF4386 [Paenibacillus cellulosilyticus]
MNLQATRRSAKLTGVLFIVAAISSIFGLLLYDPILNGTDYLSEGAKHDNQIIWGAIMELILVVSAVGTAVTMYPVLRRYSERIALGHLCFRFLEAVIITVGIVSILSLLTLSRDFTAAASPDLSFYHASGTLLIAIHDWTFLLGPNFMLGINTMMYSYIFYRSGLVPRFLSILGMTGGALVLAAALFEMFGVFEQVSVWGGLLSLPVAANEMALAVILLARGFNESRLNRLFTPNNGTTSAL